MLLESCPRSAHAGPNLSCDGSPVLILGLASRFRTCPLGDCPYDDLIGSRKFPFVDAERMARYDISGPSNSSRQRFPLAFLEAAWTATSLRSPGSMIGKFRCGRFADAGGDATPIKLLVFVAGKFAVATESRGERPDAGAVK